MNPIYKFEIVSTLGTTTSTRQVYPVWRDLSLDWDKESGTQYFRKNLNGELTFLAGDYDWIAGKGFETTFALDLYISYNGGATWASYWTGEFYKTDCEFDSDNKSLKVQPSTKDEYNEVVAGMEKEYNLIELAPVIQHVKIDKRPMYQIYSPGESVIACFLSGMYWEQDATETDEEDLSDLHFTLAQSKRYVVFDDTVLSGNITVSPSVTTGYTFSDTEWRLVYYGTEGATVDSVNFTLTRLSDNAVWGLQAVVAHGSSVGTGTFPLSAKSGGATGTITIEVSDKHLYSRYVLDVDTFNGSATYDIPSEDITDNNRNYSKCAPYAYANSIFASGTLSSTPTEYGIYQPGQYYTKPSALGNPAFYPIAKSAWDRISLWFMFPVSEIAIEESGRKQYTLKDAYPLWSAIKVILGKIAPNVKHENTADYSRFLYGTYDPITTAGYKLVITPKSNILAGDYDQPAQKAPVTLKMLTDMLRDCFKCYWFIEKVGTEVRFRIEHILYFMNGGSYSSAPVVGKDLTSLIVTRNGKPWAYGTGNWKYDKLEMPERYEFGWMDDVTQIFEGYPIEVESKYVEDGNIESVNVTNFTSDVDYMLLNPSSCDEDGFALLGCQPKTTGMTYGAYLDVDGEEVTDADYCYTPYIAVTGGSQITWNVGTNDQRAYLIEYTEAKAYNDSTVNPASGSKTITLASDTKYIRLGLPKTAEYTAFINAGTTKLYPANDEFILPYLTCQDTRSTDYHILQNGYMSFFWLQQYYMYDLPSANIDADFYGSTEREDFGIARRKTQDVTFPALNDLEIYKLVKTSIGNGQIEKISLNLSSRIATVTLNYDTE